MTGLVVATEHVLLGLDGVGTSRRQPDASPGIPSFPSAGCLRAGFHPASDVRCLPALLPNRDLAGRRGTFRHVPTGSACARQAFAKHGAILGFVLTAERLMHEGNERLVAPRIRKYGRWRIYDPVAVNDRWWHKIGAGQRGCRSALRNCRIGNAPPNHEQV